MVEFGAEDLNRLNDDNVSFGYICSICRNQLIYIPPKVVNCNVCGLAWSTIVACVKDHFVCPPCDILNADFADYKDRRGMGEDDLRKLKEGVLKLRTQANMKEATPKDYFIYGGYFGRILVTTTPNRIEELGAISKLHENETRNE